MSEKVAIRFMTNVSQSSIHGLIKEIEACLNEGIRSFRILISSSGGIVSPGIAAYNFLKGIPAEIETINFGTVESIAVAIYCAGTKRYCVPNARFLIHDITCWEGRGSQFVEEGVLEEAVKGMHSDRRNFARIIAESCKKDEEEIKRIMLERTFFTPKEAQDFGLVTEINDKLIDDGMEIITIDREDKKKILS